MSADYRATSELLVQVIHNNDIPAATALVNSMPIVLAREVMIALALQVDIYRAAR